jgi:hypothetical protein
MILTTKTTRRDELRMRNDPSIKVMCLASELRDYGFGSGMTYWERPYQHDSTASRPLSEVKHVRAWLVLRWGTTLESQVLFSFWRLFAAYDPSRTRPKVYLRLLPVWYCFNRILPTSSDTGQSGTASNAFCLHKRHRQMQKMQFHWSVLRGFFPLYYGYFYKRPKNVSSLHSPCTWSAR